MRDQERSVLNGISPSVPAPWGSGNPLEGKEESVISLVAGRSAALTLQLPSPTADSAFLLLRPIRICATGA